MGDKVFQFQMSLDRSRSYRGQFVLEAGFVKCVLRGRIKIPLISLSTRLTIPTNPLISLFRSSLFLSLTAQQC